jgi:hypothetical protein
MPNPYRVRELAHLLQLQQICPDNRQAEREGASDDDTASVDVPARFGRFDAHRRRLWATERCMDWARYRVANTRILLDQTASRLFVCHHGRGTFLPPSALYEQLIKPE